MSPINQNDLRLVADRIGPLDLRVVFTGGAIVPFLLDDPQFLDMRPTIDVDLIVEVVTRLDYSNVEERLRDLGFAHDMSEDAPKCRWLVQGIKVDVMPARDPTGEWRVQWFDVALDTANQVTVDGQRILIISPVCFLATHSGRVVPAVFAWPLAAG